MQKLLKIYMYIIVFAFGVLVGNLTRPKIIESPIDRAIDIVSNSYYPKQYTKEELE